MKKTTNHFLPLNEILKKELGKIAEGKIGNTISLEKRWKNIVGDAVAQNAKVLYFKSGTLHVEVKNSTWLYELGFMREQILNQLKEKMPDVVVEEIKFRIAKEF